MTSKTPKRYICMEHEFKRKIGIIGGGPAGCTCAYFLQNQFDVTVFEKKAPLKTLLPTGGGRCNLAPAEYDFKELSMNYPRGEKFLYSVFSKFGVTETLEFFNQIGVKTYTQDDNRIFPISNSSADVRKNFLKSLYRVKFVCDNIRKIEQSSSGFKLYGEKNVDNFDIIVIATGGHSSYSLIKDMGHNIIPPKPSLTGLKTDKIFTAGITLKNVCAKFDKSEIIDDLLFTHEGISGPLVYKISSLKARDEFPYKITIDFINREVNLQEIFDKNPHKTLKNALSEFLPKSFIGEIVEYSEIECHKINSEMRKNILRNLREFSLAVTSVSKGGETVTSGGVDLDEVNSQNMMSKLIPNLYFCGEVLDIDGFCGGYNLQNCWSTGYVAAKGIIQTS